MHKRPEQRSGDWVCGSHLSEGCLGSIPVIDQTHLSFSGAKRLGSLDSKSGGGANNEAALVVRPTLRAPSNAKIHARAWAENYV